MPTPTPAQLKPRKAGSNKSQRRFRLPLSVIFIGGLFVLVFILSLIGLSQQSQPQHPQIHQTGNRLPGYGFDVISVTIHDNDPLGPQFVCSNLLETIYLDPQIGPNGVQMLGVSGWHKTDFMIEREVCGQMKTIGEVRNIDLSNYTADVLIYMEPQPAGFIPPIPLATSEATPESTSEATPEVTPLP